MFDLMDFIWQAKKLIKQYILQCEAYSDVSVLLYPDCIGVRIISWGLSGDPTL